MESRSNPARQCDSCRQPIPSDEKTATNSCQNDEKGNDNIVTWDGPNDAENPKNMSQSRKWLIVSTTCMMTFCIVFASSVFSSTVAATAEEFGTSSEVMLLGVALYVMGFAFGPLLWGPMSEAYGRTRPMYAGMAIFCIFQIPEAVANNLQTIFVSRFLQAVFGAAPIAILGGMYVDFLQPSEIGIAVSIFAGVVFAGPAVGPIAGSFVTESHLGWRWTAWITLILGVFFTGLSYITSPETYAPIVLRRKAMRLRHQTKNWALHAQSEEEKLDVRQLVTRYLTRPLRMIVLEPILLIITIYTALVYGILYLTFVAYPIAFGSVRGWSPGIASLPFIGLLIGVFIAALIVAVFTKTWWAKRLARTKKLNPEDRLPLIILGSFVMPIGLFWFAWTSSPSIHWAPQVISGVFIGAGVILVFSPAILYIIDVYLTMANSAIAINTFIRAFFGASFPMFATYMYDRLGVDWATSLLGFCCIALIPFPILFWKYGPKIRSLSKFAFD